MCKSFNSGPIRRRKTADLLLLKELLALVRLSRDLPQSFSRSLAARSSQKAASNGPRRAENRPSGSPHQPALICRGRATTQRAKPQDSAAGARAAHVKGLGRQEARANAFFSGHENSRRSETKKSRSKSRSKTKANHGLDHVDDRPRGSHQLRAQGLA